MAAGCQEKHFLFSTSSRPARLHTFVLAASKHWRFFRDC